MAGLCSRAFEQHHIFFYAKKNSPDFDLLVAVNSLQSIKERFLFIAKINLIQEPS